MPSIEVLYRLRQQRPDVFQHTEGDWRESLSAALSAEVLHTVYIDGGVRRGTG